MEQQWGTEPYVTRAQRAAIVAVLRFVSEALLPAEPSADVFRTLRPLARWTVRECRCLLLWTLAPSRCLWDPVEAYTRLLLTDNPRNVWEHLGFAVQADHFPLPTQDYRDRVKPVD